MASLGGIRCRGSHPFVYNQGTHFSIDRFNQVSLFNHSLSISNPQLKSRQRVSASLTASNSAVCSSYRNNLEPYLKIAVKEDDKNEEITVSENLDEWLRDSVVEVVKNLKEAPLLVHVYSEDSGSKMKLKTEAASSEDWSILMREWQMGKKPSPDGIIFVEQLVGRRVLNEDDEEEDETKVWGVVVQGRGVECEPVCYLLKTCRVGVGGGLGLFCTHFVLVRVKSFTESALSQLEDCWLLH
ncbi:unnamed protein product [Ilex paraguariensis]|uniref:DUF7804 domain-containing protein n=1 Tax=Ilex paraguariensis TaxID=185542 RepID=A0ABC8QT26_9AQUA